MSAITEAAILWWESKRPPGWTAAQHKPHPWINTFGPEETMLAVACADGPDCCIEAAAWQWFHSVHTPVTIEGKNLDAVLTQASEHADTQGAVMRVHKVSLPGKCERYAGTGEDAKYFRDLFMETFSVGKKAITIEQTEIPTAKDDLLEFVNNLLTRIDEETEGAK